MGRSGQAERVHLALLCLLQAAMAVELAVLLVSGRWVHALIVLAAMGLVTLPLLARDRLGLPLTPGFRIAAVLFFFAACVPGEVWGFYDRFAWWDLLMHLTSGFLLAGFCFVLLAPAEGRLAPALVAALAVAFALGGAAIWEVFEFTMDRLFGASMQRPMLGDPSGLTDTILDMVLDGVGALVAAGWGLHRLRQGHVPFTAPARPGSPGSGADLGADPEATPAE
jgi:hypothetical protein